MSDETKRKRESVMFGVAGDLIVLLFFVAMMIVAVLLRGDIDE